MKRGLLLHLLRPLSMHDMLCKATAACERQHACWSVGPACHCELMSSYTSALADDDTLCHHGITE
jgi:hypothetical protein